MYAVLWGTVCGTISRLTKWRLVCEVSRQPWDPSELAVSDVKLNKPAQPKTFYRAEHAWTSSLTSSSCPSCVCVFQRLTIPSGCPTSFAQLMRKCWKTEPRVSSDKIDGHEEHMFSHAWLHMFSFCQPRKGQSSRRSSVLWSPCQTTANCLNSATLSSTTRLNGGNVTSRPPGQVNVFITLFFHPCTASA